VVDFDPNSGTTNLTSAGAFDFFVQKLDKNGNLIWAKQMGGNLPDYSNAIAIDPDRNVYITGHFEGTADFDPSTNTVSMTASTDYDIFVQKLNINGDLLWVKQIQTPAFAYAQSISSDAMGNVYVAGIFDGTVDFDPGTGVFNLQSKGAYDIFVQKLDANGSFLWAKQIGGSSFDHVETITTDQEGNVYTTGGFYETVDFDPNIGSAALTSVGGYDVFIQKMDANGNLIWVKQMGGTSDDYSKYIQVDRGGNVYTIGYYKGTADFDPNSGVTNLLSKGESDIFIQKLRQQCVVSDLTTTANMLTIVANNTNATYQWLDCDANHSIIQGATNNQYTATQSGNYAVELTENACVDTSACVFVSTINIHELDKNIKIKTYPNPTKGAVTIRLGQAIENLQISITNSAGQEIFSRFYPHFESTVLNVGDAVGVYFLTLKTATDETTISLIKE